MWTGTGTTLTVRDPSSGDGNLETLPGRTGAPIYVGEPTRNLSTRRTRAYTTHGVGEGVTFRTVFTTRSPTFGSPTHVMSEVPSTWGWSGTGSTGYQGSRWRGSTSSGSRSFTPRSGTSVRPTRHIPPVPPERSGTDSRRTSLWGSGDLLCYLRLSGVSFLFRPRTCEREREKLKPKRVRRFTTSHEVPFLPSFLFLPSPPLPLRLLLVDLFFVGLSGRQTFEYRVGGQCTVFSLPPSRFFFSLSSFFLLNLFVCVFLFSSVVLHSTTRYFRPSLPLAKWTRLGSLLTPLPPSLSPFFLVFFVTPVSLLPCASVEIC